MVIVAARKLNRGEEWLPSWRLVQLYRQGVSDIQGYSDLFPSCVSVYLRCQRLWPTLFAILSVFARRPVSLDGFGSGLYQYEPETAQLLHPITIP
jgi:hypothetical protein